jgi:hypothetical protein
LQKFLKIVQNLSTRNVMFEICRISIFQTHQERFYDI